MGEKNIFFQHENNLLNLILDHSFGNIFVTDGQGKVIYVNQNTEKAFGVPREVLLSMTVYEIVEKKMATRAAAIEVLEKKKACVMSVTLSSDVTLAVSAQPLFNENGEIDYVVVFSQNQLIVDQFMGEVQHENQIIRQTLSHIMQETKFDYDIIAESPAIQKCLGIAGQAAKLDSTIMLYGESGVGKEVVANFTHKNSLRCDNFFMAVNCAAIPNELMESEFFGYEKGAFTGSNKGGKIGLFQLADKGTLFLDEVGELNLSMQSKLLRVLETGEIRRIGGTRNIKVDVRIIAATNRDLDKMVSTGEFREDLYYRLNVIPIIVPSLKDRLEDIPALAVYFLDKLNQKYSKNIRYTYDSLQMFQKYSWPGNVRELRNVVERLFVIASGNLIGTGDIENVLGTSLLSHDSAMVENDSPNVRKYTGTLKKMTEQFQKDVILEVLKACNDSVEKAARQMGMSRSGLYKKMDMLGIRIERIASESFSK